MREITWIPIVGAGFAGLAVLALALPFAAWILSPGAHVDIAPFAAKSSFSCDADFGCVRHAALLDVATFAAAFAACTLLVAGSLAMSSGALRAGAVATMLAWGPFGGAARIRHTLDGVETPTSEMWITFVLYGSCAICALLAARRAAMSHSSRVSGADAQNHLPR